MIARIALPIIIIVLLSTIYFDWKRWSKWRWWQHVLHWVLPVLTIVWTVKLAKEIDYFPDDIEEMNLYISLLFVFAVPLFLIALFGLIGQIKNKSEIGETVGLSVSVVVVLLYLYGIFFGFSKLEVRHVELAFEDLPEAFDGYKIVQFGDAHVGTLVGKRAELLHRVVDSINAQHADMVVFTGDLQNKIPDEIEPHKKVLSSIKAKDGVYSVLGNHDYAEYVGIDDPRKKSLLIGMMINEQSDLGWKLLCNTRQRLRRDSASIVIAGMENDGEGRFPELGDINTTLYGVNRKEFVIMLEHDPTSWKRKILRHCHAQLTLSGHTHGGQLSIFGWSPAELRYRECAGLYNIGDRMLYVTTGIGGVVPFRLGANAEIVVITLKKKNK